VKAERTDLYERQESPIVVSSMVSAVLVKVQDRTSAIVFVGIFDNEFFEADPQGNVAYASAQPRFLVQTSTLPSGADYGDSIAINSVNYKVRIIQPDGTGMTTLVLEKQ